jgi:pyruvate dehydrogenase E2 component (dihydrolipoamide acetyltransferase)
MYMPAMAGVRLTGWRKIANAVWDGPNDPQIYGALEIDATSMVAFMDEAKSKGHRVTPTHIVGRAIGRMLEAVPVLNMRIVGSKAYAHPTIDVFFIAAVEGGTDLSGVKISNADKKPAIEIARELSERAKRVRKGDDPDFKKTKSIMDWLPVWLLRIVLRFMAWLTGDRAMGVKALGAKALPFGSAMVTSVGMFGIPMGFAPLAWMYRVPLLILVGELTDKPVVVDKKIEIRPILPITATIDHRYADGAQLGKALKAFRAYLADPAAFEPELTSAPP